MAWKFAASLGPRLASAHETGALRSQDLKRVTVDTTVQPKAITFPTDTKLLHAAIKGLNRLARKHGGKLRQSYPSHRQDGGDDGGTLRPRQAIPPPRRGGIHGGSGLRLRRLDAKFWRVGLLTAIRGCLWRGGPSHFRAIGRVQSVSVPIAVPAR